MTTILSPAPKLQFFGADGNPLVGGKLYSYAAGTSTPLATYTDSTGTTANTNPVILDSRGEANVWLASADYKFVLNTSTDTLIWTVDNISAISALAILAGSGGSNLVGFIQAGNTAVATTVQTRLRQTISVKDFGAVGNGVADDTTAIQNGLTAAAGKELWFPAGTYIFSSTLTIPTSTHLLGDGPAKTTIKMKPTFALNTAGMVNANTTQDGSLHDANITFEGITFDGSSIASRTVEFIAMKAVNNFQFLNSQLINHTYIALASSGCANVLVSGAYFGNIGQAGGLSTGVWLGNYGALNSTRCLVTNSQFIGNLGSACSMHCNGGTFTNNFCYQNGESVIFGNGTGSNINVTNNYFNYTARQQISAQAIELATQSNVLISGNYIANCDSDGITVTDTLGAIISNNIIVDCGRDTAYYAFNGGITILKQAGGSVCQNIQISGNRIYDSAATGKKMDYGVIFSGVTPMEYITVQNNDFTGVKTAALSILNNNALSSSWYVNRNRRQDGVLVPLPITTLTFQAPASTGNYVVSTSLDFVPRTIQITATNPSSTVVNQSVGTYNFNGTYYDTSAIAVSSTNRYAAVASDAIINLIDATGAVICKATVVSATYGSVTLNFSNVTLQAQCQVRLFA
jgi:hypothetical protein